MSLQIAYDEIRPYMDQGLVTERNHPEDPDVAIFNYSGTCAFKGPWDRVTRTCRGLILRKSTGLYLANPFPKFHNFEEHKGPIPDELPVVDEKLDGSLGVLYWLNDKPWVATRGAFESPQAIWATNWLRENIDPKVLPRDKTLLWEIILPPGVTDQIFVCHYEFSGLVFLACRDIATGQEDPHAREYWQKYFRIPRRIPPDDFEALKALEKDNEEGFVVFYPKAMLRLKVKFDDYKRKHKCLTGITGRRVWDMLRNRDSIEFLLERLPDEFYKWFSDVRDDLERQYKEIKELCDSNFASLSKDGKTRKDIALQIVQMKHPGVLFAMLDGKDTWDIIWKMLKPKHSEQAFGRIDEDNA